MEQIKPIAEVVSSLAPWPCAVLIFYLLLKVVEKTGFRFKRVVPKGNDAGGQTVEDWRTWIPQDVATALAPAFDSMVAIAQRQLENSERHLDVVVRLEKALLKAEETHNRVLTGVQILIDRTGRTNGAATGL